MYIEFPTLPENAIERGRERGGGRRESRDEVIEYLVVRIDETIFKLSVYDGYALINERANGRSSNGHRRGLRYVRYTL